MAHFDPTANLASACTSNNGYFWALDRATLASLHALGFSHSKHSSELGGARAMTYGKRRRNQVTVRTTRVGPKWDRLCAAAPRFARNWLRSLSISGLLVFTALRLLPWQTIDRGELRVVKAALAGAAHFQAALPLLRQKLHR